METPVLEIARQRLAEQIVPPPRIVDLRTSGTTALAILLEPEEGRRFELVIDVDPAQATLHTRPASPSREGSGPHFASRIAGGYLIAAERGADAGDRAVGLVVRKPGEVDPGARDWTLMIHWTGGSGNVLLLDSEGIVREALRPHLHPQEGERYRPPDPRTRVVASTQSEIAHLIASSTPREWCKNLSRLRGISRLIAWEALWTSLDLEPEASTDPIELLTERATHPGFDPLELAARIDRRLRELEEERRHFHEKEMGGVQSRSHHPERPDSGRAAVLHLYRLSPSLRSILPAAIVSERALASLAPYRVPNAPSDPMAILASAYSILAGTQREQIRRSYYERRFQSQMQRLQRIREKVAEETGSAEEEPRLRLYGEAILANLHKIKKGDTTLICEDWTRPGAPLLEIPLDPARPATDAADQYFKRARRAAKARPIRMKRIAKLDEAMARLSVLESRMRDRSSLPDASIIESELRDALRSFYKEPSSPDPGLRMAASSALGDGNAGRIRRSNGSPLQPHPSDGGTGLRTGSSRTGKSDGARTGSDIPARRVRGEEARFRPREFTIRDGWKVIVGRSNEENDYVTHRLAKQEDYWFHASGVPGSHVVLKRAGRKDNPSTKAIEEAAAIAAFYSKSRNSRKAPVIYTLKKYVHKPRKARAGLATCTNEKTVMVAPMNPEEGMTPDWITED